MKTLVTLLCLSFCLLTMAQSSPFNAGAMVGLNLTQIDGDRQFGYEKKGLSLGLKGGIQLNKRLELSTELLYNFKGATPSREEKKTNKRLATIDLHYAEIPILIKMAFVRSDNKYYKWHVFGGLSYGRLLQSKTQILNNDLSVDTTEVRIVSQNGFKTSDVSAIFGATRYLSPNLGISLRHTVSLFPFYIHPNPAAATAQNPANYAQFRNYFLSLHLIYHFVTSQTLSR